MKNVLEVTTPELDLILENTIVIKGMANIINLTQYTAPKLLKKDRDTKVPFSGVINKVSTLSAVLNTEYKAVVENKLEKEGNGEEYVKGKNTMPIEKCDNNNFFGTYYGQKVIEYKPKADSRPRTKYLLNSKITNKVSLPNVLPVPSTGNYTEWRKLYTKGIRRISINGQKYKVVNP